MPGFARNAKSVFLSTIFFDFLGNATNDVGSAESTYFEEFLGHAAKNLHKKVPEWGPDKVPESVGLVGDDLAVL